MRRIIYIAVIVIFTTAIVSCVDLNVDPLSEASSGTWFKTEKELEMAANDFYALGYWNAFESDINTLKMTDNFSYRAGQSWNSFLDGTITTQSWGPPVWTQSYNLIARANTLLEGVANPISDGISESVKKQYAAEAYFCRASKYADLLTYFGDIPYVDRTLLVEEAATMSRTSKEEIIPLVYADFDKAIEGLPVSHKGVQRFTKGAALALKARFALFNEDYDIVIECTQAIMDLGIYSLHNNYAEVFLQNTRNIPEYVFAFPRSFEFDIVLEDWVAKNLRTRTPPANPGYGSYTPSWSLFATYQCIDGLPIEESPLFDPAQPFENRDPRCNMTIVEWGTTHLGVEYDPRPGKTKVMSYASGTEISNNDCRSVNVNCSHNGLMFKKGIDDSWLENGNNVDRDFVLVRYADILLMYAEAKIESRDIDKSVLDAINEVRARAYGTTKDQVSMFPVVTTEDQAELRIQLRYERRVEFPMEFGRYWDILRWDIGKYVLRQTVYGVDSDFDAAVTKANWFWVVTPTYDETTGLYDFSANTPAAGNGGTARVLKELLWQDHYKLFPIPEDEVRQNPNLLPNNPGY